MTSAPLWPVVKADELLLGVVHLFAARPDLPQKVIGALARQEGPSKIGPVFDHLFVVASGEADGAKDNFAGYRVRRPEEIDAALRALDSGQVIQSSHKASQSNRESIWRTVAADDSIPLNVRQAIARLTPDMQPSELLVEVEAAIRLRDWPKVLSFTPAVLPERKDEGPRREEPS